MSLLQWRKNFFLLLHRYQSLKQKYFSDQVLPLSRILQWHKKYLNPLLFIRQEDFQDAQYLQYLFFRFCIFQ